ncbi:hypothetical protein KIW84_020134 [Lathyrus oleraceus]|uniref:Uncharacterized protein n=1 Tax=Pisum sativum TaxID=3888 RepID=A0A9D4Y4A7_PEA|nr:hypothetical protein KIW84_020134 [Pisum sativum]
MQSRNTSPKTKKQKLAKSNTPKGDLGKKERLGGLKTRKGDPGKRILDLSSTEALNTSKIQNGRGKVTKANPIPSEKEVCCANSMRELELGRFNLNDGLLEMVSLKALFSTAGYAA